MAPTVVLAIWAGGYLLDCFWSIAPSGQPLDVYIPTEKGAARLRAETWHLDLAHRRITAHRAALFSPAGDRIAFADEIVASAPSRGPGAYDVSARGLVGTLERLRDGSFRHADLLPAPSKEGGDTAYRVTIESGSIVVKDDVGGRTWTCRLEPADVTVSGVGDKWLATGDLKIAGVGTVSALLRRRTDKAVDFEVVGQGVELAPLLAHFTQGPEGRMMPILRACRAASLKVTGKGRGVFVAERSPRLEWVADVEAQGRGVGYGGQIDAGSASFLGRVDEAGMQGRLTVKDPRGSGTANGALTWNHGVHAGGSVDYSVEDSSSAPSLLRSIFPKSVRLRNGRFRGWVSFDGPKAFQVDGYVTASMGTWAAERLDEPELKMLATPDRVALKLNGGRWLAGGVDGHVEFDLKGRKLSGLVATHGTSVEQACRHWGGKGLSGRADVQAVLGGTTDSPQATLRAQATASVAIRRGRPAQLGTVQVAGRLAGGELTFERLAAAGPNGVFSGEGKWNTKTRLLNADVLGSGILLSAFQPDLQGTALLKAHLGGSSSTPKATGRIEVVGAQLRDETIPFVGGEFDWDGRRLQFTGVTASKGATTAEGEISWFPKDDRLQGRFGANGVLLRDWLKGGVAGSLSVVGGTVEGTAAKPLVGMTVQGRSLAVEGIKIDGLKSSVELSGNKVSVGGFSVIAGKGVLTGKATYDLKTKTGQVLGEADGMPLDAFLSSPVVRKLLQDAAPQATIAGSWSGRFDVRVDSEGLKMVGADGELHEVALNGTSLGNGDWQVALDQTKWSGSLTLGQLDRYIEIPKFEFDSGARTIQCELEAYRLTLRSVLAASKPLWTDPSSELAQRLSDLDGTLDLAVDVAGSADNPDVDIRIFDADNLQLSGAPSGKVALKAKRVRQVWDLEDVEWEAPDGRLAAKGRIDENGSIDIDGELSDFQLSRLGAFDSDLARLSGRADVPFLVSGPTKDPEITASLKGDSFGFNADKSSQSGPPVFDLNLTNIALRNGNLHAEGGFVYQGITGNVDADVPFEYPFRIPDGKPLHAELILPKRPLSDLAGYAKWINFAATEGSIQGSVEIDGPIGTLIPSGSIKVDADKLAFQVPKDPRTVGDQTKLVRTEVRDLHASVNLQDRSAMVSVDAVASEGGSLTARLRTDSLDPLSVLEGATQELLNTPIAGTVNISELAVDENFGKQGQVAFRSTGAITIGGQIRSPKVAGKLDFSDTSGTVPAEFTSSGEAVQPVVNPTFNVDLSLGAGSKLRSSTTEFYLHGQGSLTGSLSRPVAAMNMEVERGSIKLPNARIRIEPGGTMNFNYAVDRSGNATPRMDIALTGNTSVTALRFGDTVERYNISMRLTGDILDQGQLNISAQSDPPDLTQDRIMAILGQGDLFQGLAKGNETALAGYAIPAVFDPVTEKLAQQLGLEYLSLEYDMFDRTMLTAARGLGRGFSIMGRRQVSDTTVGPLVYDFRLSYRLPFVNSTLRSFSFGIGTDQDHPWKITFEYGTRF